VYLELDTSKHPEFQQTNTLIMRTNGESIYSSNRKKKELSKECEIDGSTYEPEYTRNALKIAKQLLAISYSWFIQMKTYKYVCKLMQVGFLGSCGCPSRWPEELTRY